MSTDSATETEMIPDGGDDGGMMDTDSETVAQQLQGNPCNPPDNPWGCTPVYNDNGANPNYGCDIDNSEACAWGLLDDIWGFYCFEDSTEGEGDYCSENEDLYCGPGLTCILDDANDTDPTAGTCEKMCCDNGDCGAGQDCIKFDVGDNEGFIYIADENEEIDLGVCM
jgi:hypothetical protein